MLNDGPACQMLSLWPSDSRCCSDWTSLVKGPFSGQKLQYSDQRSSFLRSFRLCRDPDTYLSQLLTPLSRVLTHSSHSPQYFFIGPVNCARVASRMALAACLSRILWIRLGGSGWAKSRRLLGAAAPLGVITRGSVRAAGASAALGPAMCLSTPAL